MEQRRRVSRTVKESPREIFQKESLSAASGRGSLRFPYRARRMSDGVQEFVQEQQWFCLSVGR